MGHLHGEKEKNSFDQRENSFRSTLFSTWIISRYYFDVPLVVNFLMFLQVHDVLTDFLTEKESNSLFYSSEIDESYILVNRYERFD